MMSSIHKFGEGGPVAGPQTGEKPKNEAQNKRPSVAKAATKAAPALKRRHTAPAALAGGQPAGAAKKLLAATQPGGAAGPALPPAPPQEGGAVHAATSVAASQAAHSDATASTHAPTASSEQGSHLPGQLREDVQSYLEDTKFLHAKTKWARKAMPMVMQSTGLGLALGAAIHNPLLLLVAPVFLACGALLGAPAGWLISRVLLARVQRNPEVIAARARLADLEAQDNFGTVRQLAHHQIDLQMEAARAQGALMGDAARLTGAKLERARHFVTGEHVFDAGFRSAFLGPYKFWRRQFSGSVALLGKTKMGPALALNAEHEKRYLDAWAPREEASGEAHSEATSPLLRDEKH